MICLEFSVCDVVLTDTCSEGLYVPTDELPMSSSLRLDGRPCSGPMVIMMGYCEENR